MSLKALKQKAFQNKTVRNEYDKLAGEFEYIEQLISMRAHAGLTQDDLAKRIGTAKSNISRLEGGRGNPSWSTLRKYASACGYRIKLEANEDTSSRP
ncbi:helix-turn-helix domain-containing protein [Marinobacter bohaiensis]|uniref:helix-turn-helix domain-containing protein n=1 Tax=Marinobacter bohaiensis TaxID=2201898 RepID=UPI000DAD7E6C|nr:helix-turn-helix transcriptional regulator [Marinobacter bohaiensis]